MLFGLFRDRDNRIAADRAYAANRCFVNMNLIVALAPTTRVERVGRLEPRGAFCESTLRELRVQGYNRTARMPKAGLK